MKKNLKRLILGALFVCIGMLLKGPTQDRVSSDYHAWKKHYDEVLVTNKAHYSTILNPDFIFDHMELILVSPGKKYYSRLGHIMLRFSGSVPGLPNEDFVLSFLADFNDFPVDNGKASIGLYTMMPKLGPLKHYTDEYIKGEARTMTFYPVHASKEQQKNLLQTLRKWIMDPKIPGGYSFFYNNCVNLMTTLFQEAKLLPTYTFYGYWPYFTIKRYAQQGLIDYE